MKLLSTVLLAGLLSCLVFPCVAASAKPKASAGTAHTPTNAPSAQVQIPKSDFVVPANPQQGKDPFFPQSMRLFSSPVVKTNSHSPAPAPVVVELKLNGISGTPDHRLAIINNHTFEVNEEGTVSSASRRVPIRCLDIQPDAVRVLVNGQEQTLHLRPGS